MTSKTKKILTDEETKAIEQSGAEDAATACDESGSAEAPDGGWYSWLREGLTLSEIVDALVPARLVPADVDDRGAWLEGDEDLCSEIEAAYERGAAQAAGDYEEERSASLAALDAAGWRVCVFGLPGSDGHHAEIAAPGAADEVSARIYQPGACGPYDSQILTISEAARVKYLDGNSVYGDLVAEAEGRA